VSVQRKDGAEFDGLLHTCDVDASKLSVVLFGARERVPPSSPVSKVLKQLTVEAKDVVQARLLTRPSHGRALPRAALAGS